MNNSDKMKKGNKLVMAILTEDEKVALTLSINYGKSSWQSGELMGKAHYKYLEIQARANQLFKMYNEYFLATGNLKIPSNCLLNHDFRDYILYTVFERKTTKEAVELMGHSPFIVPIARERILTEGLTYLSVQEDPLQIMLYDLIMEYDRWNNTRILPESLREPSAFKRRNKMRLIKHLKNLSNLDPFHIYRFSEKWAIAHNKPGLYIPIISKQYEGNYEIFKIKANKETKEYVSKHLRLYLFDDYKLADEYASLVSKYINATNNNCKEGQKFWPAYRKMIEKASNYIDVNNIIPRRKELEKAFRDMDNINMKKQRQKIDAISKPAERVNNSKSFHI